MASFSDLPLEMKQNIFNYLPVTELLDSCLVCHSWKTAIAAILPLRNVALRLHPETDFKAVKKSSIRYTALDIGVTEFTTPRKANLIYDVVEHYKRKSNLKQLYITVDSTKKLLEIFKVTMDLFIKLQELHITFLPVEISLLRSRQKPVFKLHLPELRRFSWQEPKHIEFYGVPEVSVATQFIVSAPKLRSANLQFRIRSNYWEYTTGFWLEKMTITPLILRESNQLTELRLRLGDNVFCDVVDASMEHLRRLDLAEVTQRQAEVEFEWDEVFRQTKQLEFIKLRRCHSEVFQAAMKHCRKLKSCEIITDWSYSDGMFAKLKLAWPNLERMVIRGEEQKDLLENGENPFCIPYLPDDYIEQLNVVDVEAAMDEDWVYSEDEDEDYYDA